MTRVSIQTDGWSFLFILKGSNVFKRRIGTRAFCAQGENCPDIWELDSGSFAVIGADRTEELKAHLPADAGCGDAERIVVIDRHVLLSAKADIPDA